MFLGNSCNLFVPANSAQVHLLQEAFPNFVDLDKSPFYSHVTLYLPLSRQLVIADLFLSPLLDYNFLVFLSLSTVSDT